VIVALPRRDSAQRQGGYGDVRREGAEEKFPSAGGVARQRQGGLVSTNGVGLVVRSPHRRGDV